MQVLAYRVDEPPSGSMLLLSSVQWFVFTLASVITVPVVLGPVFGMGTAQTGLFVERTLFVSGLIGLLQVLFGHRLPVIEGPAGMWWGVWLVLAQMTRDTGGSLTLLLQELSLGMAIAGALYLLIGALNLATWVQRWFTPIVSGTFMVLLSLQLSRSLVSGMLGSATSPDHTVQLPILGVSVFLVGLTVWLTYRGRGLWKSFAVLVGIVVGWLLYAAFGWIHLAAAPTDVALVQWPRWFPYGHPHWHTGVVLTSAFTAVILLSNFMTSVQAMELAAETRVGPAHLRRGMMVSGLGSWLSGLFGTVGCVPLATSASLVALTGIAARLPFVVASIALMALGFLPSITHWLATLPEPVGYAVLFTVFGQLLGFGLQDFRKLDLTQRDLFVISLSVLSGVGIYFIPASAWTSFPPLVGFLFDNGLIVGIALVLILEHVVFRQRPPKPGS